MVSKIEQSRMAKIKGSEKTGGRKKGTPNKATADLKSWVSSIIDNGREQFESDMSVLEPRERVKVYTGLLGYIIPKQQTLSVEAQIAAEFAEIKAMIEIAPDEAITKMAEKMLMHLENENPIR